MCATLFLYLPSSRYDSICYSRNPYLSKGFLLSFITNREKIEPVKKKLRLLSIVALVALTFLVWNRSQQPEQVQSEPLPELPKAIEKINQKIPKRLAPEKKLSVATKKEIQKSIQLPSPKSSIEVLPEEEIAVHIQMPNGDLVITSVTVVDDMIVAHGDLIVGQITDMEDLMERSRTGEPIILPMPRLWVSKKIPYVIDNGLKNSAAVEEAIENINRNANVEWVLRSDEKDFVRFKVGPLNCYSPLGKIGGEQAISLSPDCTRGSIMHEMLHTMGLLHEQNRFDRDKYIKILWENIDSKNHLQFQKIKNDLLDLEEFPFDFKSIMLYSQSSFSKYPGDFTIVRVDGDTYYPGREELSKEDLRKLNSLYPKK